MLGGTKSYLRVDFSEDQRKLSETILDKGRKGQDRRELILKTTPNNVYVLTIYSYGHSGVSIDVAYGPNKGYNITECFPDITDGRRTDRLPNLISNRKVPVYIDKNDINDTVISVKGFSLSRGLSCCLLFKCQKKTYSEPIVILVKKRDLDGNRFKYKRPQPRDDRHLRPLTALRDNNKKLNVPDPAELALALPNPPSSPDDLTRSKV